MPMRPDGWSLPRSRARWGTGGHSGCSTLKKRRCLCWIRDEPTTCQSNISAPSSKGYSVSIAESACKAMQQVKEGKILLAYCWAHLRRDFLTHAKSRPEQEGRAMGWVNLIGQLYQANKARLQARGHPWRSAQTQFWLRQCVDRMRQQMEEQLSEAQLLPAKRKVLESLKEHWEGLMLFVEHHEVPMDNNAAKRELRGPVVGRKNDRGSGSV